MKATGVVRKIDELGRIVLPVELRRTLNIGVKDSMEIFVDGDCIVLKQYRPCCIFCGDFLSCFLNGLFAAILSSLMSNIRCPI